MFIPSKLCNRHNWDAILKTEHLYSYIQMKHRRKQAHTKRREIIKKGITTSILIFFGIVILFQKHTPITELQFVRNIDETSFHGAANDNPPASQRDYLFQNEAGNPVYQWPMSPWTENAQITNTPLPKENMDNLINPNKAEQSMVNTGKTYTWTLSTWAIATWTMTTWTVSTGILTTWAIESGYISTGIQKDSDMPHTNIENVWSWKCITPWKEEVKNKDFILAYQQRKDVNIICNVEKRVCTNGVLWGTFTQNSCEEKWAYTYQKAEVISYNQKVINEYIQVTAPKNAWSEFNTQGKINTTEKATNTRWTSKGTITTQSWVKQTPTPIQTNCTTPRGQKIKHGQFIKAYQASRGFIDLPCNVEIRACVQGNLKGTFIYPKCTFNNTSYTEYIKAGLPESNKWFLFFQRIKSVFTN